MRLTDIKAVEKRVREIKERIHYSKTEDEIHQARIMLIEESLDDILESLTELRIEQGKSSGRIIEAVRTNISNRLPQVADSLSFIVEQEGMLRIKINPEFLGFRIKSDPYRQIVKVPEDIRIWSELTGFGQAAENNLVNKHITRFKENFPEESANVSQVYYQDLSICFTYQKNMTSISNINNYWNEASNMLVNMILEFRQIKGL